MQSIQLELHSAALISSHNDDDVGAQLKELPGLPRVMLLVSSQTGFTRRVMAAASKLGLVGPSVQWIVIGSAADEAGDCCRHV